MCKQLFLCFYEKQITWNQQIIQSNRKQQQWLNNKQNERLNYEIQIEKYVNKQIWYKYYSMVGSKKIFILRFYQIYAIQGNGFIYFFLVENLSLNVNKQIWYKYYSMVGSKKIFILRFYQIYAIQGNGFIYFFLVENLSLNVEQLCQYQEHGRVYWGNKKEQNQKSFQTYITRILGLIYWEETQYLKVLKIAMQFMFWFFSPI
eukprot:TRINITY_DN57451_c0_g1_i17.p5 TRINITY_DN57451_c0_g1~~TRINITY_DN57451_c0_g1_i17.p5  ORF type:complete len:203 (-),score=3.29 TRINITY_DN57451_c0_g1_i17:1069-1677(-)